MGCVMLNIFCKNSPFFGTWYFGAHVIPFVLFKCHQQCLTEFSVSALSTDMLISLELTQMFISLQRLCSHAAEMEKGSILSVSLNVPNRRMDPQYKRLCEAAVVPFAHRSSLEGLICWWQLFRESPSTFGEPSLFTESATPRLS